VFQRARIATIGKGSAVGGASPQEARTTLKSLARQNAQLGYTLLKAFDWKFRVRSHVRKHFANERFDIIYCSYPSLASPFTGIMLKRMGLGRQVITDFRDPVCVTNTGLFNVRRWIQRYLIRNSDLRFYISAGQRDGMVGQGCEMRDKVLNNGYDPEDVCKINELSTSNEEGRTLRFVYTGTVYGGKRDLGPFFSAMSEVIRKTNHSAEDVVFEYAGSEGELFKKYAESVGLGQRVIDHGRLTRAGSLRLQKSADICLLATWNTDAEQGVLTGKVFEYFMLRKPILAIVSGNRSGSEIGDMIDRLGAGHCFECATPERRADMEEWLSQALDVKILKGSLPFKYNERVDEFGMDKISENLRREMATMLKSGS
jgi:hypothetical protein